MRFLNRNQVESFCFESRFFDEETMTAHLRYGFNDGAMIFEETIRFENAPRVDSDQKRRAVDLCLRLLHLAAGVSYYKAYIPSVIKMKNDSLTKKEADFFNAFYMDGLGEFSFRNNVSLRIDFPFDVAVKPAVSDFRLTNRCIVPVGGGKDSIVTIESLKAAGHSPVLFSVGNPRPIRETIELSGLPSILATRKISPDLIDLNARGQQYGALNGHVPVTGIIAFILMLAAVLYDFSDAVLSNERSANVGNTVKDNRVVNHQWSKSVDFERRFHDLTADVLPDFHYFSLLRPLSELAIAKLFSKIEKYDAVFTSCNRAFRLDEKKRLDRWCSDCDKCRFVFLALAPFMGKDRLVRVFGRDMLDDEAQTDGYKQLLGLKDFKPFECVGEVKESALAFLTLARRDEWKNDKVISSLASEVERKYAFQKDALCAEIFTLSEDHLILRGYHDVIGSFKEQTRDGMGKRA